MSPLDVAIVVVAIILVAAMIVTGRAMSQGKIPPGGERIIFKDDD